LYQLQQMKELVLELKDNKKIFWKASLMDKLIT
jgi:hypothetical protein